VKPALSIVIPTYKRADILERCLEHIEKQTIVDQLEVIVVSDGRDDRTRTLAEKRSWKFPFRFLEIKKGHQGIARNRGVAMAQSNLCLFIGDDIFLKADACEKHLTAHQKFSLSTLNSPLSTSNFQLSTFNSQLSVLGFTTWDPKLIITPLMRWLEKSGWQFGYPKIQTYAHDVLPSDIQQRFTYTSHISVPTEVAKKYPFREDVTLYGWEDIEWGLRLKNAGVQLFFEPDARAYHHHPMTLEQSLKRMRTLGESAVTIEKLVPELKVVPRGWKHWSYQFLSFFPTMQGKHRAAFLRGIHAR
jgi:glycosyltransferase involved in cell wall biosynthesis